MASDIVGRGVAVVLAVAVVAAVVMELESLISA